MDKPHIRIEIDDIGKVPAVYIDDKRMDSLVRVNVNWNTADQDGVKLNSYSIEALGDNSTQQGFGQQAYSKL
ncbi:hypothetical protein [Liquorilactobacillus nagelii]|jgi:hypothetical protein|uniref:hypothetical protein n=1 Tax=Liquorilactobacillus nagelii TaxID=82688 RepID=UPI0006F14089|nr:hypothetical protein [Liquorilactobacillus nagelii]KRL40772.1 hypothetical protein FD45_GL001419 [Liquorilactobacillus nagelii DSM 13675]QYH53739.1 hypothetical protein G6O73_03085 [Liquorilactobacillus nagelii DSM 13675]